MAKTTKINVKGTEIVLSRSEKEDFISLTDIARYRDSERTNYIIQNWMRTRNAIEFCGNSYIILILKASNSMPLKMNLGLIALH